MSSRNITRKRQQIDDLFKSSAGFGPEMQIHWSRYLCVLVAGFVETSVQSVYSDYAGTKSHVNITRFVNSTMQRFQNSNMQKILDMTRSFNPIWAEEIEDFSNPRVRDSINSILANRNLIAHGKSTEITVGRLQPWYKDAVSLIEFMQQQCES